MDSWMGDLIESAGGRDKTDVLIDHVRTRRGEGGTDPHWWQDPGNAVRAVGSIRDALSSADPAGRPVQSSAQHMPSWTQGGPHLRPLGAAVDGHAVAGGPRDGPSRGAKASVGRASAR